MKFSKEQQIFIGERNRHVVTAAIPGAGKTTTIVQKIYEMLADGSSVIGVTYTREAADSLRQKTFAAVPLEWQGRCRIGTFHSLALRALSDLENSPIRGCKLMDEGKAREQRSIALENADLQPTPERLAWFEIAYSCVDDPFGMVAAQQLPFDDPHRDEQVGLAELRRKVVKGYEAGLKTNRQADLSRVMLTALEFVQAGHRLFDADHLNRTGFRGGLLA